MSEASKSVSIKVLYLGVLFLLSPWSALLSGAIPQLVPGEHSRRAVSASEPLRSPWMESVASGGAVLASRGSGLSGSSAAPHSRAPALPALSQPPPTIRDPDLTAWRPGIHTH